MVRNWSQNMSEQQLIKTPCNKLVLNITHFPPQILPPEAAPDFSWGFGSALYLLYFGKNFLI